ncbi:AAA family ATPase [Nocardioides humilatus]|uniref:AAA family ATPase n=1 Tax=Nocardioides humilatus TaxID=2607660 RepID=A0A5B1LAR1_9ACTN|nr:adenylate/guanylate cyclase domain-containing protein [Nocardioides humilatus]KAA1417821.1 AAA family ATPase [Nocardioides humilatus]
MTTTGGGLTGTAPPASRLQSYLPNVVIEWLRDSPEVEHRQVDGTLLFADISGFTALTEKLAARGKAGAEKMGDVLNITFEHLLADAGSYGAALVKWGGDAVLLSFTGPGHVERACRAGQDMQETLARVGTVDTSPGTVELGMAIGIHTGTIDLVLARTPIRELVVTGPAATGVTTMEKHAERGQVVVSATTAQHLRERHGIVLAERSVPGLLLDVPVPAVAEGPIVRATATDEVLAAAVDPSLREHLTSDDVAYEHRHVAVGFVLFSGVDALLADQGPEAMVDALRSLLARTQNAVAAQRITLLSTDVNADGGKLIIVSGAPRATGDDEARVLAAIRDIIELDGPLTLRGGVNNGRVFAGDYGPRYRRVYSLAGDCVNTAARLMAAADPGEVRTLAAVLDASRTRFSRTALPPFVAKGKAEPLHSFAVGPPESSRSEEIQGRPPLVGRDAELAELQTLLAAAVSGAGRRVDLSGERGMGKSRLIAELCADASGRAHVFRATGEPYASATPYVPWHQLMRSILGVAPGATKEEVAVALHRKVGSSAELSPWLPLLGIVAGLDLGETPEVTALDAQFRKARLESVAKTFLREVIDGPALWCFEDPHLMDAASVDLLRAVSEGLGSVPWLVVAACPLGQASPWDERADVQRIVLGSLTDQAARELLQHATVERPLAPHRLDAILRRADGNPLYLREIVAAVAAGADVDAVPVSVEQLAAAHVDRLVPSDRRLLRTASVLGTEFAVVELLELLEGDVESVAPDFARLGEFLSQPSRGRYAFGHEMLREAAYEGLPFSRRIVLHARAAKALERRLGARAAEEGGRLSAHFLAAELFEAAWRYAVVAAERAREQYALDDASTLYRRALVAVAHVEDVPAAAMVDCWESLGDVSYTLGEFAVAEDAFHQAQRSLRDDDPIREAGLHLRTARVVERRGELTEALGWLDQALVRLAPLGGQEADQMTARVVARQGYVHWMQGDLEAAIGLVESAETLAASSGELQTLAFALRLLDLFDLDRGTFDTVPRSLEALKLLDQLSDRVEIGHTHGGLGARAFYQGRWTEAVAEYRWAHASFSVAGDTWNAATMNANLAEVLIDQGDLPGAESLLEQTMPVWRASGQPSEIAFGEALLGRVAARKGDAEWARTHLVRARQNFVAAGEAGSVRWVDALAAEASLYLGEPEQALASAEAALGEAPDNDPWVPLLHRVRGESYALLGRPEDAVVALRTSIDAARGRFADHEIGFGLDALLRHDLAAEDADDVRSERDRIFGQLGIEVAGITRPIS